LREKLDYPSLKRRVIAHAAEWKAKCLLIEDAALGMALIQDLRADPTAPQPIAIKPEHDKVTRMAAAAAVIESRAVYIPKAADWLDDFALELRQFPHGAQNDQVDALSQFLNWAQAETRDEDGYSGPGGFVYIPGIGWYPPIEP
jgi:predicted phage terminase large subunit-like protein